LRKISSFVITRTTDIYPAVVEKSKKAGLLYPYPHFYIWKDEVSGVYQTKKTRPLSERCANIRDSRLNNSGVGIVVNTDNATLDEEAEKVIGGIIAFIIEELGIYSYTIVTDELKHEKFVDVTRIQRWVASTPPSYARLLYK